MKPQALVSSISIVAAVAIALLAWLLVPTVLWSAALFASVATLVVIILSPRFIGAATIPVSRNDAAQIGSIGAFVALFGGSIILSVIAIKLAFVSSTASFALLVLTYAILIGGSLVIRSSGAFILGVSTASDISHETQSIIASLQSAHDAQDNEVVRQRIEKLILDVRFGPTPHAAGTAMFHEIQEMSSTLAREWAGTSTLLDSLEKRIIARQSLLVRARSRV